LVARMTYRCRGGRRSNMNLIALGINHNSAAVDLRERVAFAPEQVAEALVEVCDQAGLDEAVILSTCNRTELYAIVPDNTPAVDHVMTVVQWMVSYHHLSFDELHHSAYHHQGNDALRHLVQVASGLDSMVLGEPQIFGQLKSAYAVAAEAGTVGSELGRIFQRVFTLSKRVRTDTAIGENPVSVAYAAVDLAGHIFSALNGCSALLVGAGETIELVARHLVGAGLSEIVIANRTLDRARELAQKFGAEAVLLSDIPRHLSDVDIVITSTASQLPILGKGAVEQALKGRKHRPWLMIDLAVPRDIEPQVGELSDVYLYCVDDLREIVDENLRSRSSEARKADTIIEEGVQQYMEEERGLVAVDTVKEYRAMAEQVRTLELQRAQRALARGDDARVVLEQLARAVTNKLIHAPTAGLKHAGAQGRQDLVDHARQLLGLESEASSTSSVSAQDSSDIELPPTSVKNTPRTLQ